MTKEASGLSSRSEPGRVMQANGGDCMRACVASLFNIALSEVPDLSDHGWQTELREWARPRGYGFVTIECPNEDVFRDSFSDGFLIVAGQSARDRLHAVIYKDGKLWHDPHPASTGIDRVRQVDFFYPLLPSAPRSERRTLQDDVPLKCEVIDGAIQFIIGAKVLAHAVHVCPALYDGENDRGLYKVTDPAAFAKELVRTLNHESEDGSTRMTKMLDEAVEHAIEHGAEGIEENNDALPAERPDLEGSKE